MADDTTKPVNSFIVGVSQPPVPVVATTDSFLAQEPRAATQNPSNSGKSLPNAHSAAPVKFQLPVAVITRGDVGRLVKEAEAIDNFLADAAIRRPGDSVQLPRASRLLEETVSVNKLNLLQKPDRQRLSVFLQQVFKEAPILHISFNTDPSAIFQQKITVWIRQHIHPFVLLQIGLNPTIGAGCVMRTTNKYFDFSLRHRFAEQRTLLITKLSGVNDTAQPAAAVVKELTPL